MSWVFYRRPRRRNSTRQSVAEAIGARFTSTATPFLLAGLVDRGLLQVNQTERGMRYGIHQLTRQYAGERLQERPEAPVK